ncbi:MAG: NAD(P)/FAD-dependent oxidoreductase [Bryobacteraceae bacterium]
MRKILIVGGGYAGFYTAWKLDKKLRRGEAQVTIIDPRPYMTYQPFLPEVMAGSIEPRHCVVPLRSHLPRTEVVTGTVVSINHAARKVTVRPLIGPEFDSGYDIIVVTAGAVTRTFPIAGIAEHAIGLKHIEEAIYVRNRLLAAFDQASNLVAGLERKRLLTVTFVGGGFAGVEGLGELLSLATALLGFYPKLRSGELDFRLVEAQGRILPEVSNRTAVRVQRSLEKRGARIHLNTQVLSIENGRVVLSNGEEFDSNLIIWTTGNAANPTVAKHTDLPVDQRGFLMVRADLRIGTESAPVNDAWGAGDNATVTDLSAGAPGVRTVPNAQHAVRQGKRLAENIVATLRGKPARDYVHKSLGVVATLGIGRGVFQSGSIVITGFPAWLIHRGYHVLAVPTWERKVRVLAVWLTAVLFGRDISSLESAQHPRAAFVNGGEPEPDASRDLQPVSARPSAEPNSALTKKPVELTGGARSTR